MTITYLPSELQEANVSEWEQGHNFSDLDLTFPTADKCLYRSYGPSGTIMRYSFLCHLPYNTLNETAHVCSGFFLIPTFIIMLSAIAYIVIRIRTSKLRHVGLNKLMLITLIGNNVDTAVYEELRDRYTDNKRDAKVLFKPGTDKEGILSELF